VIVDGMGKVSASSTGNVAFRVNNSHNKIEMNKQDGSSDPSFAPTEIESLVSTTLPSAIEFGIGTFLFRIAAVSNASNHCALVTQIFRESEWETVNTLSEFTD
jgi:hypothetical protein